MKRLLIALFTIGLGFTFYACSATTTVTEDVTLDSNDQVFAVEALSAASLLDSSAVATLSQPLAYIPLDEETTTTTEDETTTSDDSVITDDELDTVDQYLNMIQDFLGSNDGLSVTQATSDNPDWEYMVTYSTVDLTGNEIQYVLYYNEVLFQPDDGSDTTTTTTTTEEPVTTTTTTTEESSTTSSDTASQAPLAANSQGEQNFYFDDEDDSNVVYAITGVIISGDLQYSVEGKRVVEDNGDEIMRLRAYVDKDNFVLVNYMIDAEDGNQKFFYQNMTDGVIVNRSKVRVFEEDSTLKVMLDILEGNARGKYIFNIETEDNVQYIHILYNVRNEDGSFDRGNVFITATTDPETGDIVYDYKVLNTEPKNEGKGLAESQYKYSIEKRHQGRGSQASEHGKTNDNASM